MSLNTTITEAEARLHKAIGDPPQAGFKLTQKWPFVDAEAADTLIVTLNATTSITDPKADGQTYDGTFTVERVWDEAEEDRSVTIYRSLTKVTTVTAATDVAALTPMKTGIRNIEHPFGDAGGYSTHAGLSKIDGLIYTYKYLTGFAAINALTDAEFYAMCEDTAMEFIDKELKEEDDHTLTLRIAFRRVTRVAWANQDPMLTEYENQGTDKEQRIRHWLGIQNSDEATVVAALINGGALDNVSGYWVSSVRYSDNDDGSKNYTQVLQKQCVGADSTEIETYRKTALNKFGFSNEDGTVEIVTIVNEDLENVNEAYSVLSSGYTGYTLIDQRDEFQGNGRWSVYYVYAKYTWNNSTPTFTVKADNPDGHSRVKQREADGVPIGSANTAFAAVSATSGYSLGKVVMAEDGEKGKAKIGAEETLIRGTTDQYTAEWHSAQGNNSESETTRWDDQPLANAILIYNDAKDHAADGGWVYGNQPANHVLQSVRRFPNDDNSLWTIIRVTYIPTGFSAGASWAIGWTPNDELGYKRKHTMYRRNGTANMKKVQIFRLFWYDGSDESTVEEKIANENEPFAYAGPALTGTPAGSSRVVQINGSWYRGYKILQRIRNELEAPNDDDPDWTYDTG